MSAGFRVTNQDGGVVVHDEYPSMHFLQKVYSDTVVKLPQRSEEDYDDRVHVGFGTSAKFEYRVTLSDTAEHVMPFLSLRKGKRLSDGELVSGITLRASVVGTKAISDTELAIYVLCDNSRICPTMYLFGVPALLGESEETHGMQIMNQDEEVTFDSRFKPLKVVHDVSAEFPKTAISGIMGRYDVGEMSSDTARVYELPPGFDDYEDVLVYGEVAAYGADVYEYAPVGGTNIQFASSPGDIITTMNDNHYTHNHRAYTVFKGVLGLVEGHGLSTGYVTVDSYSMFIKGFRTLEEWERYIDVSIDATLADREDYVVNNMSITVESGPDGGKTMYYSRSVDMLSDDETGKMKYSDTVHNFILTKASYYD